MAMAIRNSAILSTSILDNDQNLEHMQNNSFQQEIKKIQINYIYVTYYERIYNYCVTVLVIK